MPTNFTDLILIVLHIVNMLGEVVFTMGMLAFVWGLTKFIFKAGDERGREEGKQTIKWGLIAMFVMVSLLLILKLLSNELGFGDVGNLPLLPTS